MIIDTLGLEVLKSVETGIPKEMEQYGLLMEGGTEQISIWHKDQIQKFDEKSQTLSDPIEYKPDSIASIYKDAISKHTWKCTEYYEC